MADDSKNRHTGKSDTSHQLGAHKHPERLAAHKAPEQLPAHDDSDDTIVPAVTADVDETPKFVKYGAAVLLGLAFGLGAYVWVDGMPQRPFEKNSGPVASAYQNNYQNNSGVPNPFNFRADNGNEYLVLQVPKGTAASMAANGGAAATATAAQPVAVISGPVVYLFDYNSTDVPENADLTALASQAKAAGYSLDVKAYSDPRGSDDFNRRLSGRRARAVADYLIAHGVNPAYVTAQGMGETNAYPTTEQDRRAEVTVR